MQRIANSIEIGTPYQGTWNDYDQYGQVTATHEGYLFDWSVKDAEGNILETQSWQCEDQENPSTLTVEEILNRTGIAFGISAWITYE
jgi:hypothetical protein